MHALRSRLLAFGALTLAALAGGCGGSGRVVGRDFPTFFADVFRTPEAGTRPVALAGLTFVNQFPDDPATFDALLP